MRNYELNLLPLLFFLVVSLNVKSQNNNILSTTTEFDFLIGKEYTDVSELGSFKFSTRTGSIKDEIEISSTCLYIDDKQIFTSEVVKTDKQSNVKTRIIKDIIVLKGKYYSCEGCLLSDQKNKTIKSIYLSKQTDTTTVLIAFERDDENGKYRQINPKNYKRNPNSFKLRSSFNLLKN